MSLRTKLFQDSLYLQRTCQLPKNNTVWDPASFKLPDLPWSPRHHITQSTEVLGWVFPMDWCFLPVEGVLTPVKFSLKTVDVWNKAIFRCILQEKLESLVRVLHVPEEICLNRRWVVAPQLQTGSLRDSDVAIGLGHWLGSSSSWNISAESMNSAKAKSLYSVKLEPCSMCRQGSKMECQSVRNGSTSKWTPQSWQSSEEVVKTFLGDPAQTKVWRLADLNPGCSEVEVWKKI